MEKQIRIFLACAFGAGIGALIALKIAGLFWWVGMLVGGFTGYLFYNLAVIGQAIKIAWWQTVAWRPSKEARMLFGSSVLAALSFSASVSIGLLLLISFLSPASRDLSGTVQWVGTTLLVSWVFFSWLFYTNNLDSLGDHKKSLTEIVEENLEGAKKDNPFWGTCLLIWLFLRGLWALIQWSPQGVRVLYRIMMGVGRFIKTVFVLIHSDPRLLCGCDAAIGATIGYFVGNPLIGALAGGIIGVLNYEIISVRLFHLTESVIRK